MARKATKGKTTQINFRFPDDFIEKFNIYHAKNKSRLGLIDPRDTAQFLMELAMDIDNYNQKSSNGK